jgi:hypothetical protein
MLLLRLASLGGWQSLRMVWSWCDAVEQLETGSSATRVVVRRRDGGVDRHRHVVGGWRLERRAGGVAQTIELGGRTAARPITTGSRASTASHTQELVPGIPAFFELGAESYRRSEETWQEAGAPTARVAVLAKPNELVIDVVVRKSGELTFVPDGATNPFDNESPDINGDGIQLYLVDRAGATAWVLVPQVDESAGTVRARFVDEWNTPRVLRGAWTRTSDGYSMRLRIAGADASATEFGLGVVVNEKPAGRARRRGQLVLGGAPGEFIYLRGDREDRERLPRFRIIS